MNEKNPPNASKEEKPVTAAPPMTLWRWLFKLLQGVIIGTGAILPGVSGGVLCVIFGVYEPLMELLAHPIRTFKTHIKLLLPVLIGVLIGFIGLARLVDMLFKASSSIAIWLFIGLIAGMLPSLFKQGAKEGRPKSAWISLVITTVLMLGLLLWLQFGTKISIQPNIGWYLVCGVFWGLSFVAPGLSSSSILIFLGLYEPMTAGIANLSLEVLIPLAIGLVFFVFISARFIDNLFKKHYAVAFHIILGFVIASTIAIIPLQYTGTALEIVLCAACFIAGFVIAWLMGKLGRKVQKN